MSEVSYSYSESKLLESEFEETVVQVLKLTLRGPSAELSSTYASTAPLASAQLALFFFSSLSGARSQEEDKSQSQQGFEAGNGADSSCGVRIMFCVLSLSCPERQFRNGSGISVLRKDDSLDPVFPPTASPAL